MIGAPMKQPAQASRAFALVRVPARGRPAVWWWKLSIPGRVALICGILVGFWSVVAALGWYWAFRDEALQARERRAAIAEALVREAYRAQAETLLQLGHFLVAADPGLSGALPALSTGSLPTAGPAVSVVRQPAGPDGTLRQEPVSHGSLSHGSLSHGSLVDDALATLTPLTGIELDGHRALLVAAIPLSGKTAALRLAEPLRTPAMTAADRAFLRFAIHLPTSDGGFAVMAASPGWVPVLAEADLRAALDGTRAPPSRLREAIPATVTAFAIRDHAGHPIGVIEAIITVSGMSEHTALSVTNIAVVIAVTTALAALAGLAASQLQIAPLRAIASAASAMADTSAEIVVPGVNRYDAIGDLARAVTHYQQVTREHLSLISDLRAQEARLRQLAEAMPHIVTMRDAKGRITFQNEWMNRTMGIDPSFFEADDLPNHLHPDDADRFRDAWRTALSTGTGFTIEYRLRISDGSYAWHVGQVTPVRDASGEGAWWVGTATNTDTMRRHTDELAEREQALRAQVELLNAITNAIQDAIFRCDAEGRVLWTNPAAEAMFAGQGMPCVGRMLAETVRAFASAGAPAWNTHNVCEIASTSGIPLTGHAETLLRHDGKPLEAICSCMPIVVDGAKRGALLVVQNVTDRRRAEDERIALLGRLVEAQEAGRLRIARDLHDGLGQDLTALNFGLASLERITDNPSHRAILRDLRALADAVGASAHRAAWETRPTAMDDVGLVRALETHLEDWGHRFGIQTDFQAIRHSTGRLPLYVENAVFRVAQEALTNVARHANATTVSVVIAHRDGSLVLIIEDDGKGFDAEQVDRTRLGVAGMRERLALIDGTLMIESREGAGTSIFVRVTIPSETGTVPGNA